MAQVRLDLDLAADLLLQLGLLELGLVERLERADVAAGSFSRQIHAAELAFS